MNGQPHALLIQLCSPDTSQLRVAPHKGVNGLVFYLPHLLISDQTVSKCLVKIGFQTLVDFYGFVLY